MIIIINNLALARLKQLREAPVSPYEFMDEHLDSRM